MMTTDESMSRQGLESLIRRTLADRIGTETAYSIGTAEPFTDLGVDSIDLVHVIATLERAVEPGAASEDLWTTARSVESLVSYLHGGTPADQADER